MTLKKLFRIKLAFIALALFIGSSVLTEVANAQPTYPALPNWTYTYMLIGRWTVQTQSGAAVWEENNLTTHKTVGQTTTPIELEAGQTYRTAITGLYWTGGSSCCYPMAAYMWIDWNANGSFNDPGERFFDYYYRYGQNTQIGTSALPWVYFTVPTSAQGKTFRMRVCAGYYYYGYPPVTGTASYYGDGGDLLLTVPQPPSDAGSVAITSPGGAFTTGTQNISVRIKNYTPEPLTSCRIVWRIDEGLGTESSNTYSWAGNLAQDEEVDVVVGNYSFNQYRTYTIDAFTEFPNLQDDINPANDRGAIRKFVAPALSPGTYYIGAYGGSSSTFATITDATDYLSSGGLFGDGVLEFVFPTEDPGPAVYEGPINIGAYPSVGNNTVQFRSLSGNPEDVIIQFDPDVATPYLMTLNTVSNTSIKGLTLQTSASGNSGDYGGIVNLTNCNGVTIENNIFNNVVGSDESNDYISLNLNDSYDVTIVNNEFNDGAAGIIESSFCPRKLEISYNLFEGNTWKSIQLYGIPDGNPCTENIVKIDTNKFIGSNTEYGISSTNGTEITRNSFTGFSGGSASDAVIYVTNTDPANFTGSTIIENSTMTSQIVDIHGIFAESIPDLTIRNNRVVIEDVMMGAHVSNAITVNNSGNSSTPVYIQNNYIGSGTSGTQAMNNNSVYLNNSYAKIYNNDIDMNSFGSSVYSIYATNSQGYIANNQVVAKQSSSIFLDNSQMGVYYNSIANNSNSPALMINGGMNTIKRNIVQNEGTNGPAFVAGAADFNIVDENNYWTKDLSVPIELARWNGISCADLAALQAANGQDANSSSIEIDFVDFNNYNLGLNTFDEVLVFDDPIDFGDPMLDEEIQQTDYLGQTRFSYFMGSENIVPEVFITNQPVGIMDCIGTTGHFFGATAFVTRGVQARYEWFKDGKSLTELYLNPGVDDWAEKASIYLDALPFAGTTPGLNFDMEGTYRCLVRGSGAEPKWTESILVNALSDAEITREPEDARVDVGGIAVVEVEAHIVADEGIDDPLFQPEVQWFFNNDSKDSVKNDLGVDGHFTGAGSTILTIRNVDQELLDGPLKDGIFVVLKGACNTLTSAPAFVKLFPSINVVEDPASASACEGTDQTFEITALSTDMDATLEYQWRKDGMAITGGTMDELVLTNVSDVDAGVYDCVVTVIPGGKSVTSASATLTILDAVGITLQPVNQTVAEGNPFTLFITAAGEAPLSYQWMLNGANITGATDPTYSVTSATSTDAGIYICNVTNVCGTVASNPVTVTVTTGGVVDVTDLSNGGFALANNTPNPFADNSSIKFHVPQTTYVRLAITDVYGKEVAVLVDNTVAYGMHEVKVNASELKLSSGIYYYTLTSNNYSLTNKMVVVR